MNPEVKKMWVEALRSGEYKQSPYQLRDNDGFCCLGVLCDLHAKAHGNNWLTRPDEFNMNFSYYGGNETLPESVRIWAGLDSPNPEVTGTIKDLDDNLVSDKAMIAVWNDDYGKNFNDLANMIEEQL